MGDGFYVYGVFTVGVKMERRIGLWMYQNGGGEQIQNQLASKLNERDISVVTNLDLGNAVAHDGSIFCNDQDMGSLDLFFSYNAGQQTPYQTYLYQTLSTIIPTINNYESFELTEDKFKTAQLLKRHGINTPDYVVCNKKNIDNLKKHFHFWQGQAICKPINGWGGNGIIKLESERDLDLIYPYIVNQASPQLYLERIIENDFTDYRVDIVDDQFIACYGRKAAEGSWKTNITSGGNVIQREAPPEVIELALKAARITGLEIAGVDIIYDIEHQKYVVLEVNGIPAFATPDQEKMGINFNAKKIQCIVDLIDRKTRKQSHRSKSTSTNSNVASDINYTDFA